MNEAMVCQVLDKAVNDTKFRTMHVFGNKMLFLLHSCCADKDFGSHLQDCFSILCCPNM